MVYRLKKGIFRIKCDNNNCDFNEELDINNKIMGITEEDVEEEAKNMALDIASNIHDTQLSKEHPITNPKITKISVIFEAVGTRRSSIINQEEAIRYKEFKKNEKILKKGDIGTTICEVVKGFAFPDRNKSHVYNAGDSFGTAALLVNQIRTADIISGEDGTTIAFYNLRELSKKDPRKAKELYNKAMEDFFNVVTELEGVIDQLENKLEKEEIQNNNKLEKIKNLELHLNEANDRIIEADKKPTTKIKSKKNK